MKVIWRQKNQGWEIAYGKGYHNESELQGFLASYPAMIPFEDISDQLLHPIIMLREVGLPGSGSTDIIGIDEVGNISILECKLASNPEVKRKVIGQIMEYAAFLWRKPYEYLDDISIQRLKKPLAEAMEDALDEEQKENWDKELFKEGLTKHLALGDFRLIIAVDKMNDELRRTIEYLTEGPHKLLLFALELNYFEGKEQKIIVPHLHGALGILDTSQTGDPVSKWDAERFYSDAKSKNISDQVIDMMKSLQEFCESSAHRIWWGHGKGTGSFTYHLIKNGKTVSLFSVYSDGRLRINFGWLIRVLPKTFLDKYRDKISQIPSFSKLNNIDDYNHWPSSKLEVAFPKSGDLSLFKESIQELKDLLKDTEPIISN
ncbi:MAG: hypothetical protein JW847_02980 [Candidatus Omnitrophica bacterium]|nr:hypothetical protein [Candidatus Omnitrophota bacterium]